MATLVREAGTQPLTQFTIPYRGTWKSVAANQIAQDALYDSMNVFLRKGKLRSRPGFSLLNDSVFDNPVIGGLMAVTPSEKVLLALTRSQLYTLRVTDTVWQPEFTVQFGNTDNTVLDICFLETGGEYVGIIANGETELKYWLDAASVDVITPTVGTTPRAKSVCIAASRVVALVAPHTLRWTSVLDYEAWSDLNYNKVARTNDEGICVRRLGTVAFVLYKERSIYIGKARAGSDAAAFSVDFVQECEGPAGVRSVVDANGMHIYMTATGRIGAFDGTSLVRWICDGIWLYLQEDIDSAYAYKICGVFDYRLHTVTFFYPRSGDSGQLYGMVCINVPLEGTGVTDYAAFLGLSAIPMSHTYEMRFSNAIARSLTFSSRISDAQSFVMDEAIEADDSVPFNCHFQTGLFPVPEMKHHMCSVESFLERGHSYGHVVIQAVKSDALETEDGSVDPGYESRQVIDLEFNPVQEHIGLALHGRFIGLRYEWTSDSNVRYAGATLVGRVTG